MRRKDREITDINTIEYIIAHCDTIRIAMHDECYPYMVTLNFGEEKVNNQYVFYCHSALEGKKIDLLKKNNKVFFEMDYNHQVILYDDLMSCTMGYSSVMGKGEVYFIEDHNDKMHALKTLMKHYHDETFPFKESMVDHTCVFKIVVSELTAKRRDNIKPNEKNFRIINL